VACDGAVNFLAAHSFSYIRIVSDGLERHVWNTLVDETFLDVALRLMRWRYLASKFGLFVNALRRVGKELVRISRGHESRTGERESYAASVDSNPAAAPLLRDIGGCATAARRVKDQVAGIGSHEKAPFKDSDSGLNDVNFGSARL
jgi:hypothetical protein